MTRVPPSVRERCLLSERWAAETRQRPGWSFPLMPTLPGAVALVVTGWIYWM
ncbi:hypothetical protein AWB79_02068 [Caballeronia hypogeia]|uniref:Uncharacterized protein n=1 Tax=Caballeronia hypogeia TaxID=1777140 RepID=A0A158A7W4_9BURK|nr:hypothetical protein AWB79_02068 [Caballeronia hypogeia]